MRRPLCWVCALFCLVLLLGKVFGYSYLWEYHADKKVVMAVREHERAAAWGQLYRCDRKENSCALYLSSAVLKIGSESYPVDNILVSYSSADTFRIGQKLSFEGRIYEMDCAANPGQFDSREYYALQNISFRLVSDSAVVSDSAYDAVPDFISSLRIALTDRLYELTDKTDAGILCAILLGDKSQLESEVKTQFQMAGIVHILTVSGLHVSLIGMGIFRLLRRWGLLKAAIVSSGLLIGYGLLTLEAPATKRALVMFLVYVSADAAGRTYDMLSALSLACMLLLTEQPGCLFYSGFLLSFAAAFAIAIMQEVFTAKWEDEPALPGVLGFLRDSFFGTAFIMLFTLPVTLYFFYEVAVYGIILNVILVPFLPVVFVSAVAALLSAEVALSCGRIVVMPAVFILKCYRGMAGFVQSLPLTSCVSGRPGLWKIAFFVTVLFVMLVFCAFLAARDVDIHAARLRALHELPIFRLFSKFRRTLFLSVMLPMAFFLILRSYPEGLSITNLDVGQGDCSVIRDSGGACLVIDCGSTTCKGVGEYRLLPFLKYCGISKIDGLVVTHPDADHMNGVMELLDASNSSAIELGCILLPAWGRECREFDELKSAAAAFGADIRYIGQGDKLGIGSISADVIFPDDEDYTGEPNAGSVNLLIAYGDFEALFTGDLESPGLEKVTGIVDDVDYLKVPHHGSGYTTDEAFLKATLPEISVLSYGEGNVYGHPHTDLLGRLERIHTHVFRTARDGAVTVDTDGSEIKVHIYGKN